MTRLLITIIIFNLLTSCRQNQKINDDFEKFIDKEINDRISKIENGIEHNISRSSRQRVDATKIHQQISNLLGQIAASKSKDSVTVCLNDYFISVLDYLSLESENFIKINSSSTEEDIISLVKLNELTLLDRILLTRKNKVGNPSYNAQFIPLRQTDTTYSGNVILLKTDTLWCQEILLNVSETFKDTIYLPIKHGKGKFEVLTKKRPYDFKVCGFVKSGGQFIPYKFVEHIK